MNVVAVLAAALTLNAASVLAQTSPVAAPQQQGTVFKSGSALVALNVTVQDDGSKYVAGLQLDDFAVYEDGVKQDVSSPPPSRLI